MKLRFSAWREGATIYLPWLIIGALVALVSHSSAGVFLGCLCVAGGLFTLYFFRDPARPITATENEFVSPADGTIVAIEDLQESRHYDGPCRRVSIFLSLFNVHINRAPLAGTIRLITYQPGQFKTAMAADTTDCNEANTLHLDTQFGLVTVRQIAGIVARRIVCKAGVGDTLQKGEKFGMIKFSSRTELYLPPNTPVCVKLGDKVQAGTTILGHFQ